jgi:uncharacterized membrane protein YbhN (UPF0104 family)
MSDSQQEPGSGMAVEILPQVRPHAQVYRAILAIIKILLGLALLFLSLREIQLESLWDGLRSANLLWLCLAILAVLFGLALKLWRWMILVKNYRIRATPSRLFSAYFVGQAANILLPFRGGELIRLGYFIEQKQILPEAASTILLEKYLDLSALCMTILGVSLKISLENILNLRYKLLPATIFLTLLLITMIIISPKIWGMVRARGHLPQRIVNMLDGWIQTSLWLRKPKRLIPLITLTSIIWGVMWVTNLLVFRALQLPLGGTAGGLVLVLVYIGLFPALMPGNIGPFYFFARLALSPFAINPGQAVIFAVILHAIVTLPPLFGGVLGLFFRSPHPTAL